MSMLTKTKIGFYITYLFFLAIWLGAAFHDSFSTNYTWYTDPLTYINHTTQHNTPGALNPWPFSTAVLLLLSIIAFFLFIKYAGPGKKEVTISIVGTFAIIAITMIYFVPTLGKIFGNTNQYDNGSLIAMSRTWVLLNITRFVFLSFLFIIGLRGLQKFKKII